MPDYKVELLARHVSPQRFVDWRLLGSVGSGEAHYYFSPVDGLNDHSNGCDYHCHVLIVLYYWCFLTGEVGEYSEYSEYSEYRCFFPLEMKNN